MNHKISLSHLLVILSIALSGVSCSETPLFSNIQKGSTILFKTGMGYNGIATKTAYSGDGDYTGGDLSRERIDWVSGDVIRIWSDKATVANGSEGWADYEITPVSSNGSISEARISPTLGNGLVWGEGMHEFYSIYPSPGSGALSSTISGNTITALIPERQTYTVDGNKLIPDMDYAYMIAALKTRPASSVSLSFKPVFTAFEFTIYSVNDNSLTLTSFELLSSSSPLCGQFSAEIEALADGNSSSVSYSLGETGKHIEIPFQDGITVTKEQSVTFTVFTLPTDIEDLTIRFTKQRGETSALALKLGDSPIRFEGGKKHLITNLGVPGNWSYTLDNIPSITLTSGNEIVYGAERSISVLSQRHRGSVSQPFPWKVQAYAQGRWVEKDDPAWPEWVSLSAYSGDGNSNDITVSIGANDLIVEPATGLGMVIAANMSSLPEKGTEAAPFDLSAHNIYGTRNSSGAATTANCYVVSTPGWYMFPLVYGNAIKNGHENRQAFAPGTDPSVSMATFIGADGNGISSPFILQDSGLTLSGEYDACIIWEDVMPGYGLIDTESLQVISALPGSALNCGYIRFHIPPSMIKPGNAVIALRDKGNGNKILWNWHIWLAPSYTPDLQTTSVAWRPSLSSISYIDLMNVNLGWSAPISYPPITTGRRSVSLRFIQESPGTAYRNVTITQNAYSGPSYEGIEYSSTFYQWGRKDPFLPSRGFVLGSNLNKCSSSPGGYTVTTTASYANKTLFFAISGMRNYLGVIAALGERGYYWTAGRYPPPNGTDEPFAESAFFTQSRVDPLYNAPYSHAMSIRPMRE